MLLDAFKVYGALPWVAGVSLALSALWAYSMQGTAGTVFFGMMAVGGNAPVVHAFLCLTGIFSLFFIKDYFQRLQKPVHDAYALIVFAIIGMILMANGRDLLITFVGLETMSMCLYIFAALFKMDARSNESGLKYFLLGSFASAFFLMGIALIYGGSGLSYIDDGGALVNMPGSTRFDRLAEQIRQILEIQEASPLGAAQIPLMLTGAAMLMLGFLFKVAAFPFHNWAPDVYEGSPTPLAGFMATGGKMAAFIAFGVALNDLHLIELPRVQNLLAFVALLTMVYGNFVAARQDNLKRMLAYSSIAHAGYMLLGLCAGSAGLNAVIFYLFVYTLMNVGAFGIISMAEKEHPDTHIDKWRGFGIRNPWLGGALAVFMLSLAGIPPLAGFMGKYLVFKAAIDSGLTWLAVVGILASAVGAYYYLRVIATMFFSQAEEKETKLEPTRAWAPLLGVALLAILLLVYGVFPGLLLKALQVTQNIWASL